MICHACQSSHQMRTEPATTKIASAQKHLLIHLFLTRRQSSCLKSESTGTSNTRHLSISCHCTARSKVKKRGNFLFDFTSLPNVFRLNRGNIFAVPCGLLFCVHLRSNQASQLLRCTHGNKRKPQRCPSSHPSVIYRDRGNRRRSEVTEILRPAAGRRSTVKHAASGTRSEIQIRNGRAFQEALSGF